jgi:hypothetical protein
LILIDKNSGSIIYSYCYKEYNYVLRNKTHIEIAACKQQKNPSELVLKNEVQRGNDREKYKEINAVKEHF